MSSLQMLMEDFARRNGIDSLQPESDGTYRLLVDDDVQVQCFERFTYLYLLSPLGRVPQPGEARRAWLKRLLNAALKQMKQSPGTPALAEDGSAILYARLETANLSVIDLENRIEAHINALERVRSAMEGAASPAPAARFAQSIMRP